MDKLKLLLGKKPKDPKVGFICATNRGWEHFRPIDPSNPESKVRMELLVAIKDLSAFLTENEYDIFGMPHKNGDDDGETESDNEDLTSDPPEDSVITGQSDDTIVPPIDTVAEENVLPTVDLVICSKSGECKDPSECDHAKPHQKDNCGGWRKCDVIGSSVRCLKAE